MKKEEVKEYHPLQIMWISIRIIILVVFVTSSFLYSSFQIAQLNMRCNITIAQSDVPQDVGKVIKSNIPKTELYQHFPTEFSAFNTKKTYYFGNNGVICWRDTTPIKNNLPSYADIQMEEWESKENENNIYNIGRLGS